LIFYYRKLLDMLSVHAMGQEKNIWRKKSSRFKKPKSRVNGLNDNLNNIKKNKKNKIDKKIKD
jgi:hypothetical protein